ncbi:MAG: 2'-5' RNA ligase family protein [Christensenellales bacterium]|jgi:2'-5' RNA ligase
MAENRLCVLAEFDRTTQLKLRELQQRLRESGFKGTQNTRDVPYHMTLGLYAPGRERELHARMNEACDGLAVFDVVLNHLGLFGLEVLFMAPAPSRELLRLRERFDLNCVEDAHIWTPHVTLLMESSKEHVLGALPVAAEHFSVIHARVERISLFRFWPAQRLATCTLIQ